MCLFSQLSLPKKEEIFIYFFCSVLWGALNKTTEQKPADSRMEVYHSLIQPASRGRVYPNRAPLRPLNPEPTPTECWGHGTARREFSQSGLKCRRFKSSFGLFCKNGKTMHNCSVIVTVSFVMTSLILGKSRGGGGGCNILSHKVRRIQILVGLKF